MKKTLELGCAIVVLSTVATSTARANVFTTTRTLIKIPELLFSTGEQQVLTFNTFIEIGHNMPVVGFWFHGEYWDDGAGAPTFWASDLQMQIISPGGKKWTVGGWDNRPGTAAGGPLGTSDENWNGWAGAGGAVDPTSVFPNDGIPAAGGPVMLWNESFPWKFMPEPKEGMWTINFFADFLGVPGPMRWTNIQIDIHNIPSPGAFSLIGLAGLCALRRRR